jgi:apolipoprotein N-acyltransferase
VPAQTKNPVESLEFPGVSLLREGVSFAGWMALTVISMSLIFPPLTYWPVSFVCLAPWAIAVCKTRRAWIIYWGSLLGGWVFFLVNLFWLKPVTDLGFVALALYLAIYWPMAAWAIRTALRVNIGVTWTLPLAWTACEFLRGWVMTGIPWLFLSHAFFKHTSFIQISDITGAYGVTFLVAMVNGLIVDLARRWSARAPQSRQGWQLASAATVTVLLLAGNLAYGRMRLQTADFKAGPSVAVVQESFLLRSTEPFGEHPYIVFAKYLALAAEAAREKPDLVVFPETVWQGSQNIAFLEVERRAVDDQSASAWMYGHRTHRATAAFARGDYQAVNREIASLEALIHESYRKSLIDGKLPRLPAEGGPPVSVIVGSIAIDVYPEASYPKQKKFNTALMYDPDGTQRRERYDKIHLVPFGEYVPFRNSQILGVSFHWLYRSLNRLSPFSRGGKYEYSLWPGTQHTVFNLDAAEQTWRFGVPICYEDVMPNVVRQFVWDGGDRRTDFLINISNDGWFLYSAELEQHLAICVFRAVENRVAISRAVNTGISGFIDPDGRMYSLVSDGKRTVGKDIIGYRIENMKIDNRGSFYGRYGDLFAMGCLIATSVAWLSGILTRWVLAARQWFRYRQRRKEARA